MTAHPRTLVLLGTSLDNAQLSIKSQSVNTPAQTAIDLPYKSDPHLRDIFITLDSAAIEILDLTYELLARKAREPQSVTTVLMDLSQLSDQPIIQKLGRIPNERLVSLRYKFRHFIAYCFNNAPSFKHLNHG